MLTKPYHPRSNVGSTMLLSRLVDQKHAQGSTAGVCQGHRRPSGLLVGVAAAACSAGRRVGRTDRLGGTGRGRRLVRQGWRRSREPGTSAPRQGLYGSTQRPSPYRPERPTRSQSDSMTTSGSTCGLLAQFGHIEGTWRHDQARIDESQQERQMQVSRLVTDPHEVNAARYPFCVKG